MHVPSPRRLWWLAGLGLWACATAARPVPSDTERVGVVRGAPLESESTRGVDAGTLAEPAAQLPVSRPRRALEPPAPQPEVGGEPRVVTSRRALGDLADLVPADFPWAQAAIAVVPGRGRPPCCQVVVAPPRSRSGGEPVAVSSERSGVQIVGTTLVVHHVSHAPGLREAYERGNWRTPGAALYRVPRWVTEVQVVTSEGMPMP